MKLLLITYYFPPCGGAGVQRWLRLIKALDSQGVRITVITTKDGDYPHIDESLSAQVPTRVKVLRSKPIRFGRLWKATGQQELPYGSLQSSKSDPLIKRILYWLRLNLVVPDMRMGWNPSAYRLARLELQKDKYDWLITTGPPHSTHLIGLKLKQRLKIKWLADWRDPMSQIYYLKLNPPLPLTLKLHKHLERKVIQNADLNLIVSHSIAAALPNGKKAVLYNGFDADDFKDLSYARADSFRIKFVGQLTAGQDSRPLLESLTELEANPGIKFYAIGSSSFPGTSANIIRLPYLPHQQALGELVNAELLVLFINTFEGNEGMLTTKLFEYIASRTPILCLATPGGEAEELINKTKSGSVVQNKEQVLAMILEHYQAWKQGKILRSEGNIAFLSSQVQAKELLNLL